MSRLFASVDELLGEEEDDRFTVGAARFLAELNAIHPFREGNGRAQLVFMSMLGDAGGFPFDFTGVQRDSFLPAMVSSYSDDLEPLIAELYELRKF